MTFSKYDEDFAQAMKTKLKLNRERLAKKTSLEPNKITKLKSSLTNSIIKDAMKENPDLSYEEADRMMKELGA